MSTPAQIAANIANAQSSTGPRTEAGKAASSKNSVTHGLYSGDFIRPGEESAYETRRAKLFEELAPIGTLEETYVDEIHRATWRLRRCGEVESHLVIGLDDGSGYIFDPMETANVAAANVQKSVDRARAQAHRILHKCTAELRRLQAERRIEKTTATKQTQPQSIETGIEIARSAQCPCNSGQKYKRCCGRSAPPILNAA